MKEENKCVENLEFDSTDRDLLSDIESIVDESAIYITDSECIDELECYEDVIGDILQLVGIENVEIEISEEESTVCLNLNGVSYTIYLNDDSDYISSDKLVKGLNEFLEKLDKPGKIYWFWNCDWGQEMGFLYTEKTDEVDALMSITIDPLEYGEISDGFSC